MSSRPRTGWWTWGPRAATTADASLRSARRSRWRPTRLLIPVIICVPRWRRQADSSASGHELWGASPGGRLPVRVTGQYAALLGVLIGALGGAIYWLAAQIWPSSVAVILAMSATALLTTEF